MVKIRRSHQPRVFNFDILDEQRAREIQRQVRKVKPLDNRNIPHERSYSALLRGKAKFSNLISEEELDKRASGLLANIRKNRKKLQKLSALGHPHDTKPEVLLKKQKLHNIINDKITKLQMIQTERLKVSETTRLKREIKQGIQDGDLVRVAKGEVIPSKKAVKQFAHQNEIDKVFSKKAKLYVIFNRTEQRIVSKPGEYEKVLAAASKFSRKHPKTVFEVRPAIET